MVNFRLVSRVGIIQSRVVLAETAFRPLGLTLAYDWFQTVKKPLSCIFI